VTLELEMQNSFYDDPEQFNVIADLPGTDSALKSEVVMIGAHLDSWSFGTGATDNAAGCAASLSTFNLYMDGPEDPLKTVTASKLLNVTTDRTKTPHHYVNLKTSPGVLTNANTFTYPLQAVTDEAPGTYTIGVRATLAADGIQAVVKFAKIQIGTSVKETSLVETVLTNVTVQITCAKCHLGPISGKMYLAHINPSSTPGSVGDWARDLEPVKSCKLCHNNDGYASFIDPSTLGTATTNRISDHIVRRVHGIHMGSGLQNYWNTNQVNGVFSAFTETQFPAEIKNCTVCHADDRWKTQPSRLACGACHDNIWFGANPVPSGWATHAGGQQKDDSKCTVCHGADPDPNSLFASITEDHQVSPPPLNAVAVSLTPPANQKYYVDGEKPVVSLVFKNDAGNSIGDHTVVDSTHFGAAALFVYGPRSLTLPVLTSTADLGVAIKRPSVTCSINGPWDINGKTFKIGVNGSAPQNIVITGTSGAVTPAEVVASLNTVITNFNAKAAVSGTALVNIASLIRGAAARIEIYNGDVTTAMGWKAPGVVLEPDVTVAAVSTPSNDLRPVTNPLDFNDPKVTRTTTNIQYQLDDVKGLTPGTYCAFVYYTPKAPAGITNWAGLGFTTFQVGTATVEKKIAGNCMDCHSSTPYHLYEVIGEPAASAHVHPAMFDPDQCKACHDYGHPNTGDVYKDQGGTSLNGWSGYGAMPISRRVHGVHFAHYLDHSEEIYDGATKDTFGWIIFPQDVRNCTKCHAESDTWKQKPSRLTCLACHDSDGAKAHGRLMTYIPDPTDPYGPSAQESCEVCHGANTDFSPDKVHSISNPYVPPYPRDP
jgi:hypothetical protein